MVEAHMGIPEPVDTLGDWGAVSFGEAISFSRVMLTSALMCDFTFFSHGWKLKAPDFTSWIAARESEWVRTWRVKPLLVFELSMDRTVSSSLSPHYSREAGV